VCVYRERERYIHTYEEIQREREREKERERKRERERAGVAGEREIHTYMEKERERERQRETERDREILIERERGRPLVAQTSGSRRRRENLKHARLAVRSKVICTSFALAAVTCPCPLETFSTVKVLYIVTLHRKKQN
jgi:hypothetical protein